jgi:hypothetical protein
MPTISSHNGSMQVFASNHKKYSSPRQQAEAIWREQVEPSLKQGKPVGLIYSANNNQAQGIYNSYQTGKIDGVIGGGGQALVFAEIAKMIQERKLQDKVHILPVATSMRGGDNTLPGNQVGVNHIDRDVANIASHRAAGWDIRGMGTPGGKNAIGGGFSKGWFDPKNANVSGLSQGEYVQRQLDIIASKPLNTWPPHLAQASQKTPMQVHAKLSPAQSSPKTLVQAHSKPLPLAPLEPMSTLSSKWKAVHESDTVPQPIVNNKSLFTPIEDFNLFPLKNVESSLQKGLVVVTSEKTTALEHYINKGSQEHKNEAADLLALASVKNVMGNLATQVQIEMVENNRSGMQGHDKHAMKIQFKSAEEASEFATKLFKEHGIHSHTLGAGVMKTPQNNAIYLTPDDLDKISKNAKLTTQENIGVTAFNVKAKSYEQSKSLVSSKEQDKEDISNLRMK